MDHPGPRAFEFGRDDYEGVKLPRWSRLFKLASLLFICYPIGNQFMKRGLCFVALICAVGVFSASAAEKEVGVGPKFKGPVGLQLYSLRGAFAKDVPGTLDKVKSFGFKYVELASTYNMAPDKFRQMLDQRGLVAVSAHFPYERYRD